MVGGLPRLSLKEKVLLWLVWVEEVDEGGSGGLAPTQAGIATSAGLSRGHVSRTLKGLTADGVLRVEPVRVTGFSRVLKAYRVTEKGWEEYARLRRALLDARVSGLDPERPRQSRTLQEALPDPAGAGVLWQALERLETQGHLDETFEATVRAPASRARFELDLNDAPPRPSVFVGRDREMQWLQEWLAGQAGVCAIEGPGGLGKTSLLLEALAARAPQRHVLWLRLREWSTLDRCVERIGGFVTRLGRQVPAHRDLDPEPLAAHLARALKGLPILIVFDDTQKAERHLKEAVDLLAGLAQRMPTLKLCLVGREVDLGAQRLPAEARCRLAPLRDEVASRLLTQHAVPPIHHAAIVEATGGVPLFLEVLAERHVSGTDAPAAYRRLVDDLGTGLAPADVDHLCQVAAIRLPFSAHLLEAMVRQPRAALDGLATVGLVKRRSDGLYEMHDLVRKAFYDRLSPHERKQVHGRLAEAYRPRQWPWAEAEPGTGPDVSEYLHHLVKAGRRDEAVRWVLRNQSRIVTHARRLAETPFDAR